MTDSRLNRLDRRVAVAVATAWIIMLLYAAYFRVRPWPDILLHIDFSSYWTAASLIRDGAGSGLFDMDRQYAFQLDLRHRLATTELIRGDSSFNPYPNPPLLALLYLPLTLLPISWAYMVWSGISLASFVAAVTLSLRGQPLARTSAVMMLSFVAVTHTLFEGQPYGLLLLAFVLALRSLRSGRPFLGGMLLGLLWLKPQYATLFPVLFLMKGRWRELAGMATTGAAVGAVSLAMVGIQGAVNYLEMIRTIGSLKYTWVNPSSMVNWRAVVIALLPGEPGELGSTVVLVAGVITVLISLAVWKGEWEPSSPRFARQMSAAALAVLVATPHSHLVGATLALAPLSLAFIPNWHAPAARVLIPMLIIGYLLGFAIWPLGSPRWLMAPYCFALMIILVVQCRWWPREGTHPSPPVGSDDGTAGIEPRVARHPTRYI